MKKIIHVKTALILTGLLVLGGFIIKTQSQVRPPDPQTASERISRDLFFGQRIIQVGAQPASEAESQLLWELLDYVAVNNNPFGNTTASSGSLASANVYRFSNKEIHDASGLYYYGYRFYAPNLQRWLNRDPINELGHKLTCEFLSRIIAAKKPER